jgi:hypothetical protein
MFLSSFSQDHFSTRWALVNACRDTDGDNPSVFSNIEFYGALGGEVTVSFDSLVHSAEGKKSNELALGIRIGIGLRSAGQERIQESGEDRAYQWCQPEKPQLC